MSLIEFAVVFGGGAVFGALLVFVGVVAGHYRTLAKVWEFTEQDEEPTP